MLLCCITLSSSRENQCSAQEVSRRISGAVAGESTQKSTYQVPITNPYLPHYIICHLPLVFLSPTSPFLFCSPSLSVLLLFLYSPLFACFLFPCVSDCLLVVMANPLSSPLSPKFDVLHFKERQGENLKDAWFRMMGFNRNFTLEVNFRILLCNFLCWIKFIS